MTKFDRAKFDMGHGSERWVTYEGKFVARFKHARPGACANHFVKFLIANFTVEEYFELRERPHPTVKGVTLGPSEVLATKGFIDYNTLQAMKRGGFATKEELLASIMAGIEARRQAATLAS